MMPDSEKLNVKEESEGLRLPGVAFVVSDHAEDQPEGEAKTLMGNFYINGE